MAKLTIFPLTLIIAMLLSACDSSDVPAAHTTQAQMSAIASGAEIAGANGIHIGPDGLLYIASVVGSDITVIDPETGETIKRYTADDGVVGPDDVAFGPDGSFFWTSILTGEVAGFTPDGEKVVAAELEPGVNPITFSDDGRLFTAQCFLGDKLYEVDPKGIEAPRLISDELGPNCGLNGMDWGPDARLYGPRWFKGEVVSFDVDDNTMRTEASGFQTPAAVKFDSKGRLHVLDTGTGEVIRIDGEDRTVIASLVPGLDNFAFDDEDRLFVSSFADGFIKRIDDTGITTLKPGGMAHPGGIAMLNGNVVVADNHAIRAYNPETGGEAYVQRNVVGVGKMGGAINLASDGDDLILVSWFSNDVRVWNPKTQTLKARYTQQSLPVSAVRYHDNVVVAQHGKSRVVALQAEGEQVIATNLPAPTGLVVAADNLYASDRELGQILLIAKDGVPLPEPTVVVDKLTTPEGFVVTPRGFIVVEADTGQIVQVDSGGERTVLGEIPPGRQAASPGQPPSMIFNGITMQREDRLFVTGEIDNSLYRLDLHTGQGPQN